MLWLCQIVFIERFYEYMKTNDIKEVVAEITEEYGDDDFGELLTDMSFKNNMCVDIVDRYGRLIYSKDTLGKTCFLHCPQSQRAQFLYELRQSLSQEIIYKQTNKTTSSDMLVYLTKIGDKDSPDAYVLINALLVPLESTAAIFKKQLLIITGFLIILSLFIAYFMAKKVARPIAEITRSAEQMAEGNYNLKFKGEGYAEVQRLAATLTYASRQISKVDAMQRDLIANVSHDLRTPLTMLKAYAEMIRDLSGDNPVKRNEHLEIIINETDRLALLVNDMLDLSKLEDGNQGLNYSEFSITDLLEGIAKRYTGLSGREEYNVQFEPDENVIVRSDNIKIQQVIYNLINNAVNYTGEDKQVFVRQINKENCVRIEIADTGEGIAPDKIKLIFEKYYRSENHKREVVGTGLGLSIVKAILKKHKYKFGVYSVVGKGSTFWFEISDIVKADAEKEEDSQ